MLLLLLFLSVVVVKCVVSIFLGSTLVLSLNVSAIPVAKSVKVIPKTATNFVTSIDVSTGLTTPRSIWNTQNKSLIFITCLLGVIISSCNQINLRLC